MQQPNLLVRPVLLSFPAEFEIKFPNHLGEDQVHLRPRKAALKSFVSSVLPTEAFPGHRPTFSRDSCEVLL